MMRHDRMKKNETPNATLVFCPYRKKFGCGYGYVPNDLDNMVASADCCLMRFERCLVLPLLVLLDDEPEADVWNANRGSRRRRTCRRCRRRRRRSCRCKPRTCRGSKRRSHGKRLVDRASDLIVLDKGFFF